MKKLLVLLVLTVAVGLASYFFYYRHVMASVASVPEGTDAELVWLKREFALTPPQYAKILALHRAYQPECAGHCARYLAARQHLASLLKQQTAWSSEEGAALDQIARVRSDCHQSMLRYAYSVAACMSPDEGRRYLNMISGQMLAGDPANMMANSR